MKNLNGAFGKLRKDACNKEDDVVVWGKGASKATVKELGKFVDPSHQTFVVTI